MTREIIFRINRCHSDSQDRLAEDKSHIDKYLNETAFLCRFRSLGLDVMLVAQRFTVMYNANYERIASRFKDKMQTWQP